MRFFRLLSTLFLGAAVASAVVPTAGHGELPLFFIPNQGQAAAGVRFMAKGSGVTAYFFDGEVAFRASGVPVRMRLLGAEVGVRIDGGRPLSGTVNFLSGPAEHWRTGIPVYSELLYRDLYKGIDMSFGTTGRNLKSEFTVGPHSDPRQIRIQYLSAGPATVDRDGSLLIVTEQGTFRELPPVAWQMRNGRKAPVEVRFAIDSQSTAGFMIGDYDPSLPLVIDPLLAYSTFLGGSSADVANAIAIDSTGAAYVAGYTESYDLPALNADQTASGGGNDAFVAKLSASGNALVYCTYLGGAGDDRAFGIAVDSTGAAYVTGSTQSTNFPLRNAFQANLAGGKNAFVVKLTPAGNNLVYSTYLGGNGSDSGNGIAIDSSGNAYVAGDTTSSNFPVNSYQRAYRGGQDAFVTKLNAAGSAVVYSTYLGGGNSDHGAAIALDASGAAFVTGSTTSIDFPTLNAFQNSNGGGQDAFLARLNPAGNALLFSTYLGGSGGSTGSPETGQGVALDSSGNAYMTGTTSSVNFPILNPLQSTLNGSSDAFLVEVSPAGSLLYATYLGGSGMDAGNAIAVDPNSYVYVAGGTYSVDFPVMSAVQSSLAGAGTWDAFVVKIAPGGSSLAFATYLGGNDSDTASGVAVDSAGGIFVTGWTLSSNFPIQNAYQTQNAGNYGAFVTKYVFSAAPANVSVTPSSGSGMSATFTFQYSDPNGASDLSVVSALFGSSPSSLASSCAVTFNRAQNTLALLTDSGAPPSVTIAPGTGSAQNSQCVLNGGASSASLSGNVLSLTLALTFQPGFAGVKNIYMQAANPSQTTPWQTEGAWTVPGAVSMSVTPASGSGTQQTFTLQFSDPSGITDLNTAGILINSSASTVSGCAIIYNRAQNTLALLTDSGALPSTMIVPGSGSAQNSQCVLTGSSSIAVIAGNTLALNLQITFLSSFSGNKNIYLDASSASQTIGWTQEASWVTGANITMSVTPSSGSGNQQTFALAYADAAGTADLAAVYVWFEPTLTLGNGTATCLFYYTPSSNQLGLYNDGGTAWQMVSVGSSSSLANTQCSVATAAVTVVRSGATMTLNVPVTFFGGFSGLKNIYMYAAGSSSNSSWQTAGAWMVPVPQPSLTVASTHNGNFTQGQINANYTILVSNQRNADPTNGTVAVSDALPFGLTLTSMSGPGWNCNANVCSRSDALSAGSTYPIITVTVNVSPNASSPELNTVTASGGGSISVSASDSTIIQTSGVSPVSVSSVSPNRGSGTSQTFALTYSDVAGAADLTDVYVWFEPTLTLGNGTATCLLYYAPATNQLALYNDAGTGWLPTATVSSSVTLSNSQCSAGVSSATVVRNGPNLTLSLPLTFSNGFAGLKNIYMYASGSSSNSGWQTMGSWSVPQVQSSSTVSSPAAVSVASSSPNSGSGTSQTFALTYSDGAGAADLTYVYVWFEPTLTLGNGTATCLLYYAPATNQLALYDDTGAGWLPTVTLGSPSALSNSQCNAGVSSATVARSGPNLTLNLPVTFSKAFAGLKNIYMYAAGSISNSGWRQVGFWLIPGN